MANQQQQQMSAQQVNQLARAAIRSRAVRMCQQIYSQALPANSAGTVVTVYPRNVGMILGFWVKITKTFTNTDTTNATSLWYSTDLAAANMLSQIQFNDLSNNTRIQTPGWHINFLNSWKGRRAYGSAFIGASGNNTGLDVVGTGPATLTYQGEDSPINYGSNWTDITQTPTVAYNNATGVVTMWYYVPLAYNPDHPNSPDLRGAVYANVVNATMQLLLTVNPTPIAAYHGDSTSAVYLQHANFANSYSDTGSITVYQDYYDQLPTGNQGVLLPILDLATIYELKQTVVSSIVQGQDFPYQYANFRDFLSTISIYNNNGSYNGRASGSDISYWALQSANFTNIWKVEPSLASIWVRQHLGQDLPPGCYLFDSRARPISTTQYGNMELVLNASSASSGAAYELVATEDFALVQTLSMAGSLAAS